VCLREKEGRSRGGKRLEGERDAFPNNVFKLKPIFLGNTSAGDLDNPIANFRSYP